MTFFQNVLNPRTTQLLSLFPKPCMLAGLVLLGSAIAPQDAIAETVLEKVTRTGTLTAGTSQEAFPFAFSGDNGELQGYSVDMLKLIQAQLSKELGQEIELNLVALTPDARIPSLLEGEVDIVCDASSYTWEREKQIDFSVSYGLTGTRLMGTTNEIALRQAHPEMLITVVGNHAEGYEQLAKGAVEAFAADGILLEGWLRSGPRSDAFEIFGDLSREGIACMMPENNSQFANQVDYSLVRFMEGYLKGKPDYVATFDRWFGVEAKVPLTQDFRALVLETMQLEIDFKEEIPESEL